DLFAAEVLMPGPVVKSIFLQYFGGEIEGARLNEHFVHWVSLAIGRQVDPVPFVQKGALYRALLIAEMKSFAGTPFVSLADRFGVSRIAMAIQLVDLRLVR